MSANHDGRKLRVARRVAWGAALAALWTLPAGAAWDGTQAIQLSDIVTAEYAVPEAGVEVHRFTFFAPQATQVWAKVSGKGLAPQVTLVDMGSQPIDVGDKGTPTMIKYFPVTASAFYAFEVRTADERIGIAKLETKQKYPKTMKAPAEFHASSPASPNPASGTNSNPYASGVFSFGAMKGASVSIELKPGKGSTAKSRIRSLVGPGGPVTSPDGTPVTFPSKVKNLKLSESGTYELTVEDTTKGLDAANVPIPVDPLDTIQVTISPKWPVPKRNWKLGVMEDPRGVQGDIRESWLTSGHADASSEAFRHWDEDVPQVVSTNCARCHSGAGYEDYLGSDGSPPNVVDVAPPPTRTVDCEACHNEVATNLTEVTFVSSGKVITGLGDEARCMVCHQGRESKKSVDANIAAANPADVDTVDDTTADGDGAISFRNIHYYGAAATLYGREAEVGYQYDGKAYEKKFTHVEAYDACNKCHDEHTLKLRLDACATCHDLDPANVADPEKYDLAVEDLHDERMDGTIADFDADGQLEGLFHELTGMSDVLYQAMREYAKDVVGVPLVYDETRSPFYYADTNENGVRDSGEPSYTKWTARLVKAAFNYQLWQKDPGAFAHNGKYVMELMYDSTADLNAHDLVDVSKANGYPADLASLVRNDFGHFDTSADAYTNWEDEEGVSSSCARCHSLEGFRFRVKYGIDTTISQPTVAGLPCESCHVVGTEFKNDPARVYVASLAFPYPSTATSSQISSVSIANNPNAPLDSFICTTCHMGRQSKLTIDATVASASNQQALTFSNVHYLPASATQYSTRAGVGYPWTGISDGAAAAFPAARKYATPWVHFASSNWANFDPAVPGSGMPAEGECQFCHMKSGSHAFQAEGGSGCSCHGSAPLDSYRLTNGDNLSLGPLSTDFDGNPQTTKLGDEVIAFRAALDEALDAYAVRKGKVRLVYFTGQSSYWFKDANDDDVPDDVNGDGAITSSDKYNQFDKFMLYGAHDYHLTRVDPGSWAHNPRYTLQILYDSIDYLDDERWNGSPVNPLNGALLARPITN
jgi:hypothetical protein